jgi:hypothetical protein
LDKTQRASFNKCHSAQLTSGKSAAEVFGRVNSQFGHDARSPPVGFFRWKLPLRGTYEVLPQDYSATDEWVAQRKYPVEMKARASDTLFLTRIAMFQEQALTDFIGMSVWSRFRSHFLSAYVLTDEGTIFKVKFDSSLRKELARLRSNKNHLVSA